MEVMNPRIHKARGLGGLALSRARVLGDDVGWRCCALLGRENSSQKPVIPTHPVITSVWAGAGGEQVLCDRNLTEQKQASRWPCSETDCAATAESSPGQGSWFDSWSPGAGSSSSSSTRTTEDTHNPGEMPDVASYAGPDSP